MDDTQQVLHDVRNGGGPIENDECVRALRMAAKLQDD